MAANSEYGMDISVINIANLSIEGYVPIGQPFRFGEDELEVGLASYGSTLVPWNHTGNILLLSHKYAGACLKGCQPPR